MVQVSCGPRGKYLPLLGIKRIDLFSLDVEGAEMSVLDTIDWTNIEIHVAMIEMSGTRADEIRPLMLSLGLVDKFEGFRRGNSLWLNTSWVE
jgi:hypothetical protein